jgi:hypothetical protein
MRLPRPAKCGPCLPVRQQGLCARARARARGRTCENGGVDSDEPPRAGKQRAARVARVDGGVGLDATRDDAARLGADVAVERAHNALGSGGAGEGWGEAHSCEQHHQALTYAGAVVAGERGSWGLLCVPGSMTITAAAAAAAASVAAAAAAASAAAAPAASQLQCQVPQAVARPRHTCGQRVVKRAKGVADAEHLLSHAHAAGVPELKGLQQLRGGGHLAAASAQARVRAVDWHQGFVCSPSECAPGTTEPAAGTASLRQSRKIPRRVSLRACLPRPRPAPRAPAAPPGPAPCQRRQALRQGCASRRRETAQSPPPHAFPVRRLREGRWRGRGSACASPSTHAGGPGAACRCHSTACCLGESVAPLPAPGQPCLHPHARTTTPPPGGAAPTWILFDPQLAEGRAQHVPVGHHVAVRVPDDARPVALGHLHVQRARGPALRVHFCGRRGATEIGQGRACAGGGAPAAWLAQERRRKGHRA